MHNIKTILSAAGIYPINEYPNYQVFPTPFRPSHKSSFFVCNEGTRWVEKGMKTAHGKIQNISGDAIDLLCGIQAANTRTEAYDLLAAFPSAKASETIATAYMNSSPTTINLDSKSQQPIKILEERELQDTNLARRILLHGSSFQLARYFLTEALIESGTSIRTRDHVLLYRMNDNGSIAFSPYEVRAIGQEDITKYTYGHHSTVLIFTSILDYISYASSHGFPQSDVIITNNYKLLYRSIEAARRYPRALFFLPRDSVTDILAEQITNTLGSNAHIETFQKPSTNERKNRFLL